MPGLSCTDSILGGLIACRQRGHFVRLRTRPACFVLLHVAYTLKNVSLAGLVRVVFFDMEEIGLVDSQAFGQ